MASDPTKNGQNGVKVVVKQESQGEGVVEDDPDRRWMPVGDLDQFVHGRWLGPLCSVPLEHAVSGETVSWKGAFCEEEAAPYTTKDHSLDFSS